MFALVRRRFSATTEEDQSVDRCSPSGGICLSVQVVIPSTRGTYIPDKLCVLLDDAKELAAQTTLWNLGTAQHSHTETSPKPLGLCSVPPSNTLCLYPQLYLPPETAPRGQTTCWTPPGIQTSSVLLSLGVEVRRGFEVFKSDSVTLDSIRFYSRCGSVKWKLTIHCWEQIWSLIKLFV